MTIQSFRITNVGPFDEIEFEFDSQVNVFTGPNNSGKSSALWALGDTTVYPFTFPLKLLHRDQDAAFRLQLSGSAVKSLEGRLSVTFGSDFWNSQRWERYEANLRHIGFSKFIPALRRSTDFRSTGPKLARQGNPDDQIWDQLDAPDSLSDDTADWTELAKVLRRAGWRREPVDSPELRKRRALAATDATLVSDKDVIQKIIELDYRSLLTGQSVFRSVVNKISETASEITEGFPVTFTGVSEDDEEFYPQFDTIDGSVPLNTLSQGTQSIIQWLAHLIIGYAEYYDYPEDLEDKPGILIVDEIDAHLHPAWQRRIIPVLTRHFPRLQIFCSTHSPLMLAGLKAGQVQLLQRGEDGRVTTSTNEEDVVGWTADEILRNFLGVSDPTDFKTERQLTRLRTLQLAQNLTDAEAKELEKLKQTVRQDLVRGPLSSQLDHFEDVLRQVIADSHLASSDTP